MSDALSPTPFVDSDHPDLVAFAEKHTAGAANDSDSSLMLVKIFINASVSDSMSSAW